jgi:hypothetical protein
LGSPERHSSIAANAIIRDACSNQGQVSTEQFVVSDPSIRSKSLPHALEAASSVGGLFHFKPMLVAWTNFRYWPVLFFEPD